MTGRLVHGMRRQRRGIAAREVALIVAAVALILAIAIPYVYRQRTLHRGQICEARQFRASLAMIQYSLDERQLPGYRIVQATDADGVDQQTSWVFPILPYLHPIDVDISTTIAAEYDGPNVEGNWQYDPSYDTIIGKRGPWSSTNMRYGPRGESSERGLRPEVYIPELICPANAPRLAGNPKPFTSLVVNCGMPDRPASPSRPSDWRANGVFTDQFPSSNQLAPATTLAYVEDHDGLSNVIMLSENVDAGLWTDASEANIGFVWTTKHSSAPSELFKDLWWLNDNRGKGRGEIQSARPSSYHLNGINVAYCDGSTRFIQADVDEIAWAWMLMSDSENPKYPGTNRLLDEPYRRFNVARTDRDSESDTDGNDTDENGSDTDQDNGQDDDDDDSDDRSQEQADD